MAENNTYFINELLRKIEAKIDFKVIKFSDSKLLAEKLKEEDIHLSAHTLARAFDILPSKHQPYKSTLDMLAQFINCSSYSKFCMEVEEHSKYALAHPKNAFKTGPYSFTAFEISLQNMDLEALRKLLEAYEKKYGDFSFSNFLGSKVKYHKHRPELLEFFGGFEKGRLLFYEGFVDETDENNYFSKAIKENYLPNTNRKQGELFAKLFCISQSVYQEDLSVLPNAEKIILDRDELLLLPPQLVGRYFELKILEEGVQKNRYKVIHSHIENLLEYLPEIVDPFKCWVMGKCIKALAYTGNLEQMVLDSNFKSTILSLFDSIKYNLQDIGDLFVQLTVHKFYRDHIGINTTPKKLNHYPINEEKTKILLESLTAKIYAPRTVKEILKKNIADFVSKNRRYQWADAYMD